MNASAFAAVARALADSARGRGLEVPAFRSPPRDPDAVRTVRRFTGSVEVAVRRAGRPDADVVRDLIVGILVANGLDEQAWDLDLLEASALEVLA